MLHKKKKAAFFVPRIQTQSRFGPHKKEIVDFIVGSILGDGHLEKYGKGTRLTLHISAKNQEYLFFIHKLQANNGYCNCEKPLVKKRFHKKKEKFYNSIHLKTWTFGSFDYFRNEWYHNNGVKKIPENLAHILTPEALAYWFMDDGTYNGQSIHIATYCFKKTEVEIQAKILFDKFKIHTNIRVHNQKYFKIVIFAKSVPEFDRLVRPFVVPTIMYKQPKKL